MIGDHCSLIGTITKPHGTGGHLMVRLNSVFADDIEPGEPLFVKVDGKLVPFFIEEAEVFPDRAVLKLEFIDDPAEARRYAGRDVYIDLPESPSKLKPTLANPNEWVGYTFTDLNSGLSGKITGFIENPLNPLFQLTTGTSGFLLPAHSDFILDVDKKKKSVRFKLPDGINLD